MAGVVLIGIGTATVRRTVTRAQLPYAIIPLVCGAQQLVEGYLWTILHAGSQSASIVATVYLLFSHVLWPILIPFAVFLIEPLAARRKLFILPMIAGTFVGLYFLIALFTVPVSAYIEGMHIVYQLPHNYDKFLVGLYIIGVCLTPLLSSFKSVRIFGIAITIGLIATALAYFSWFVSVWCFFAAVMSTLVLLHFSQHRWSGNMAAMPAKADGNEAG